MKAMVVIPTYNEKENIARLINDILAQDQGLEVLVVDDDSPDGTGSLVDGITRFNGRIHLLQRGRRQGLGTAYVDGFRFALGRPEIEYVFEMDADFSHQPGYIPDFLKAVKDADVVVGSRYTMGGEIRDWGLRRRLLSRGGSLMAQVLLGLPVRDCTGGFRCYRREVLEKVELGKIRAEGFEFQIEMLNECHKKGFRIKEIPIIFTGRECGTSKITAKMVGEGFFMVLRLGLSSLGRRAGGKGLPIRPADAGIDAKDKEKSC